MPPRRSWTRPRACGTLRSDFAAIILTHGRAGSVKTIDTLRRCGYTGRLIVLIDDEDEQAGEYERVYGDGLRVFRKADYVRSSQTMCPASDVRRKTILYARNAAFDVAKAEGCRFFVELDDDYTDFQHRYVEGGKLKTASVGDLDAVFESMVRFLERSGADTMALAQGGDMLGGKGNPAFAHGIKWKRKAMNSFVFSIDCPPRFQGAVNEDVVTYALGGGRGALMLTTMEFMLVQQQTQKAKGGMTDEYLDDGTFCKSMFAVVARPDCCRIGKVGCSNVRIHHAINWRYAVPKIIREPNR